MKEADFKSDMNRIMRKSVFWVSDQVQHKLGYTTTEDGYRLEISYIKEVEGLYYLYSKNKGADQLHGYLASDLRLCFRICKKQIFS